MREGGREGGRERGREGAALVSIKIKSRIRSKKEAALNNTRERKSHKKDWTTRAVQFQSSTWGGAETALDEQRDDIFGHSGHTKWRQVSLYCSLIIWDCFKLSHSRLDALQARLYSDVLGCQECLPKELPFAPFEEVILQNVDKFQVAIVSCNQNKVPNQDMHACFLREFTEEKDAKETQALVKAKGITSKKKLGHTRTHTETRTLTRSTKERKTQEVFCAKLQTTKPKTQSVRC